MLEIRSVQTKEEQKRLCGECGIGYDADALCYAAYQDGVLAGAVQFGIRGSEGYIASLSNKNGTDDKEALFVAGRAALNFIDLCGVTDSYCEADADETLIKRIGFRKTEDNRWYIDTKGFFTSENNGACESSGGAV